MGGLGDTFVVFAASMVISLLGSVPYIIKSISYSMTPYILAEDKEISPSQAVKLSVAMTKGHKSEIFMMYLSFIGWMLLTVVTLGILGIFWTMPYMTASLAGIYEKLKSGRVIPNISEESQVLKS